MFEMLTSKSYAVLQLLYITSMTVKILKKNNHNQFGVQQQICFRINVFVFLYIQYTPKTIA